MMPGLLLPPASCREEAKLCTFEPWLKVTMGAYNGLTAPIPTSRLLDSSAKVTRGRLGSHEADGRLAEALNTMLCVVLDASPKAPLCRAARPAKAVKPQSLSICWPACVLRVCIALCLLSDL